MKKKRVLFATDNALAKTGFAKNAKILLTYLYKTGKYELIHYACGLNWSHPLCQKTPWRTIGCLPDNQQELQQLQNDQNAYRIASYGGLYLDKVVKEVKPDVYIGIQDFWGVDFAIGKPWFNEITSALWVTLDSLPLFQPAVEQADKIKNFWVWSEFAEIEMHRIGHKHVKTLHGALDASCFYRLDNKKREQLRKEKNIPQDTFIIGFVFRNQLRKSVPNFLEGYAMFKKANPSIKNTKLLFHTSYSEGWNIRKIAAEYNVPQEDILTTYICKACNKYEIKPFVGEDQDCPYCKNEKCCSTTNVGRGVNEEQLNEIYNLMDAYCHPFTSGGQEIPIQEAKLTELVTLVTNYSCGEYLCSEEACSLPLDWSEYREHGTEFRKASTLPSSICKQLAKVYNMDKSLRSKLGKKAREWTLKNYSVEAIGKKLEEFLDNAPFTNCSFSDELLLKNPKAPIPSDLSDMDFLKALYKSILKMDVKEDDSGLLHWMRELKNGATRDSIEEFFRKTAVEENQKNTRIDFSEMLDKNDEGKRILFVIPESIGDVYLCTSLFKSIKELYPDWNLYVATKQEYYEIFEGNNYVHKVIPFMPQMDNIFWTEGIGANKGYFNITFLPYIGTQRIIDYTHNGIDKIALNLQCT